MQQLSELELAGMGEIEYLEFTRDRLRWTTLVIGVITISILFLDGESLFADFSHALD